MKYKLLLMAFFATVMGWGQIISQYVETNSGTTPKGIEIWNNTGSTLNFSTNNLIIQQGTNGAAVSTAVTINTGALVSGGVIVIGTPDIGTYLTGQNLTVLFTSYGFAFTGDDALVVKYGSTTTDVFGTPGSDPGSSWTGGTVSTANQNISILSGITTGASAWTNPSLRFSTISTSPSTLPAGLAGFGIPPSNTTTYTTSWSNSAPTSSIDAIIDGDLTTSADLACKDLTINANRTLTIGAGKKLTVAGNLVNNGTIIFKSDVNGTAMFDVYNGSQSSLGVATVERYIPQGKRAFRLLSPAVTTSNNISNNWQQQTHITGGLGTTGLGFDATATNNPSMFTFDNQATSGSGWASVANTNATNLIAGTGYRVLIRGNTSVDLTAPSADAMNAAVTLSATGTLRTGSIPLNSSSSPSINNTNYNAGFSLVGNPYQSPIDWNAVTKTNIEPTYYAWDPNMGTTSQRGRYVSFNGSDNSVSVDGIGSSNVGQFIQPGQAFFVKNTGSGAGSLTFDEADKVATNANVFRTANPTTLTVSLYDPNELAIAGYPIDAMKAVFSADYTNDMGLGDAIKLEASGENMAWYRNATKLAIDAAAPLTSTDELAMKTIRLGANKNYTLKINTTNFDATLTPYLVDNFLNTQTEISTTQAHLATFNTTDVAASFGEDRFKIVFQPRALSTDDFTHGLVLYPNPAKAGDSFYVQGSTAAEVTVYNVLGQHIPVQVKSQGNALQVTPTQTLSQGIYLVTVTTEGKTQHVKWIVE
jgi:hypothetical protein